MIDEFLWTYVPFLYNKFSEVIETTNYLYATLTNRINGRNIWIFINNTHVPIPKEMFDTTNIKEYNIRWNATTNPPTFTDPIDHKLEYKHIAYLGLSVSMPGSETMDLTDWLNELKWSGPEQPKPHEIFTLWCCEKGSPLFYDLTLATVEIITEDGDVIKRGLNEFTHTSVYEHGRSTVNGCDTDRLLDVVLSSSGR